jgi:glyoxylase-like metal-dependent hydrolase (beta-lactamase superfamily II)
MSLVVETMAEIGVTRVSRWVFNCYLIHDGGGGRPVIVDAGLPCLADDLSPVFADLAIDPAAAAAIVATHGHSDHVGGASALSSRLKVPVYLSAVTLTYLEGVVPRTPTLAKAAAIWPTVLDQPFDRRGAAGLVLGARVAGYGFKPKMVWTGQSPVGALRVGETLPRAPEWRVVAAAGHTDDSLAFWHESSRTLLSGDAILSVRGRAWMTPETVDADLGKETASRLRDLPVAHLLPGHGRPVHGDRLTALALGPAEGPRGLAAFGCALARYVADCGSSY